MNTDEQYTTEAINDNSAQHPAIGELDLTDLTVLKYKVIAAANRAAQRGDREMLTAILDSLDDGWTAWNAAKMDEPRGEDDHAPDPAWTEPVVRMGEAAPEQATDQS